MNKKLQKQNVGSDSNKLDEVVHRHYEFYLSHNVDKSFDRRKKYTDTIIGEKNGIWCESYGTSD